MKNPITIVVAAILCGSALLALSDVFQSKADSAEVLRRLWNHRPEGRPILGRLTGGYEWRPYADRGGRRGLQDPSGRVTDVERLRLAAETLAEAQSTRTSESYRSIGVLALLDGDPRRAVGAFRHAVALPAPSAGAYSDLAAGLLFQAEVEQSPRRAFDALDAAITAIAIDSTCWEARFNLALALEELSLPVQARGAWSEYVSLDPDSPWSREARTRLRDIEAPPESGWDRARAGFESALVERDETRIQALVDQYPQQTYTYVTDDLLRRWAATAADQGASILEQSAVVAAALESRTGDRLVLDTVTVLSDAVSAGDRRRLARIIRAYGRLLNGASLSEQHELGAASVDFAEARRVFMAEGIQPLTLVAEYQLATVWFQHGEFRRAIQSVRESGLRCRAASYLRLASRCRWVEATSHFKLAELDPALAAYREALIGMDRFGDQDAVARLHSLVGETLGQLGMSSEGWISQHRALAALSRSMQPFYRIAVLTDLGLATARMGHSRIARLYLDEAVALAIESQDIRHLPIVFLYRGTLLAETGDKALARADLARSSEYLTDYPDKVLADRISLDIELAEGTLCLREDPASAVRRLEDAVGLLDSSEDRTFRIRRLLLLGRAYRSLGDIERARASLVQAVADCERRRIDLPTAQLRSAYFETPQAVFRELISLEAAAGRASSAFTYSERSRARSLLDAIIAQPGSSAGRAVGDSEPERRFDARSVCQRLPADVSVVAYAVLDEELCVWVLNRSGIQMDLRPVANVELRNLVDRFRSQVESGVDSPDLAADATALFDMLVRRALVHCPPENRIVFVPSQFLYRVPFAALQDRDTGRYLIESRALVTAPSAAVFVECLGVASNRAASSRQLVVGNPAFDVANHPDLQSLSGALREARRVAALYPGSELLAGEDATKPFVLRAIRDASIVHFAGHAVVNPEAPGRSVLVLAKSPDSTGAGDDDLHASEIETLRLPNTRIVVLAACKSGEGTVSQGEGIASLARPFLAAGVPVVIASLWNVDDGDAGRLFEAFHDKYSAGLAASDSLRIAQLQAIRSPCAPCRHPSAWAAFQVIGGDVRRFASGQETDK